MTKNESKEVVLGEPHIISETPDYLILDKPSGLLVHAAPQHPEADTLVDWLQTKYPEIQGVGEDPERPGIVHRLDRDVSGVMVVARTQMMFDHLKKQFQNHEVEKKYLALVHGVPGKPDGTISFPLGRSRRNAGRMASQPKPTDHTRDAVTHYAVKEQFTHLSLLEVTIETGRTNQIRAHLLAFGLPIVGDTVYASRWVKQKVAFDRPFLHSWKLGFADLSDVRHAFEAPLPPVLQDLLTNLQKRPQ
ncbi:MAG: RluA family pseudouridine synthase [Patescibacteria group bacterium]